MQITTLLYIQHTASSKEEQNSFIIHSLILPFKASLTNCFRAHSHNHELPTWKSHHCCCCSYSTRKRSSLKVATENKFNGIRKIILFSENSYFKESIARLKVLKAKARQHNQPPSRHTMRFIFIDSNLIWIVIMRRKWRKDCEWTTQAGG